MKLSERLEIAQRLDRVLPDVQGEIGMNLADIDVNGHDRVDFVYHHRRFQATRQNMIRILIREEVDETDGDHIRTFYRRTAAAYLIEHLVNQSDE